LYGIYDRKVCFKVDKFFLNLDDMKSKYFNE
jgi:hypothetical protein